MNGFGNFTHRWHVDEHEHFVQRYGLVVFRRPQAAYSRGTHCSCTPSDAVGTVDVDHCGHPRATAQRSGSRSLYICSTADSYRNLNLTKKGRWEETKHVTDTLEDNLGATAREDRHVQY